MFWPLPQGEASLNAPVTTGQDPGPSWNFGKIPVFSPGREQPFQMPPLPIQAKLKVGAIDDPLEHEADRVAEQVMRMPAPEVALASAPAKISRKCGACEDEEKLQKKPAGPQAAAGEAPAIVHEVLRAPGQPLDEATRAYFDRAPHQPSPGISLPYLSTPQAPLQPLLHKRAPLRPRSAQS